MPIAQVTKHRWACWFLLVTRFLPVRSFAGVSRYRGIFLALLNCLVKKELTEQRELYGKQRERAASTGLSLLSPHLACVQRRQQVCPVRLCRPHCQAREREKSGSLAGAAMPACLGWGHRSDSKELSVGLLPKRCLEGGKAAPPCLLGLCPHSGVEQHIQKRKTSLRTSLLQLQAVFLLLC